MISPEDHVVIELTAEQTKIADDIAEARQKNAERRNRRPGNRAPIDRSSALRLNVIGSRGETAGHTYLAPVQWHAYRENVTGLADFDDWIDTKTRTDMWHDLIVQKDDPDHWAYLLIIDRHPRYVLIGWVWGHEAKKQKYWRDPARGRPAFFIEQINPIMKPPAELLAELRKRQGVDPQHISQASMEAF